MELSKTEVSGVWSPETKKTKEGSGRSSFETNYSYSASEVKPNHTTPNTKVTALFKHVHLNMSDCPKFEHCSAPLCPLNRDMMERTHLRGERVCFYVREYVKEGGRAILSTNVVSDLLQAIEEAYPKMLTKGADIRYQLKQSAKSGSTLLGGHDLAAGKRKKHTDTQGKPIEPIPNHTETGNTLCDPHEIKADVAVMV